MKVIGIILLVFLELSWLVGAIWIKTIVVDIFKLIKEDKEESELLDTIHESYTRPLYSVETPPCSIVSHPEETQSTHFFNQQTCCSSDEITRSYIQANQCTLDELNQRIINLSLMNAQMDQNRYIMELIQSKEWRS